MKHVISFNAADRSGKTTQINILAAKNPDIMHISDDISKYEPYPKLRSEQSFRWWFIESSPVEFCETIYKCLAIRNRYIAASKAPITLVDKGVHNFDARVIATLAEKGLTTDDAKELAEKTKKKYGVECIEDLRIFLSTGTTLEERLHVTRSRPENKFSEQDHKIYYNYQANQQRLLQKQIEEGGYAIVDAIGHIDEVTLRLEEIIHKYILSNLPKLPEDAKVYGLSGLSEVGKSSAGHYLSKYKNIWNFKLNYFVQNIADRHLISDVGSLFGNDSLIFAALVVEEMSRFFKTHYYRKQISVESLHNGQLTKHIKQILGEQFETIYLEVDRALRIQRTMKENGIDRTLAEQLVEQKDSQKISRGVLEIQTQTQHILDNNSTMHCLNRKIDAITGNRQNYEGEFKPPEQFSIPAEYKQNLMEFYNKVKCEFGSDLILFLVGGSCGREQVCRHWSDIDIILGFEQDNHNTREIVDKFSKEGSIKIGITSYSRGELESGLVDVKTMISFYNMQKGILKPCICSPDLTLPEFSWEDVVCRAMSTLPEQLHLLKRLISSEKINESDRVQVLKKLNIIIKTMLYADGLNPENYEEVFKQFSRLYDIEEFPVMKFIAGECEMSRLKDYGNKVIHRISNFRVEDKKVKNLAENRHDLLPTL